MRTFLACHPNSQPTGSFGKRVISRMQLMERSAASGDQPRHWSRWDTLALLLYSGTVAFGLLWHDPWADEAQAWLIARSMGFWQIVSHGVRYEGSPALWQCFLHLLILLHVNYVLMGWVTGAMAAAGIAIFLRWSPFPPVLRLLLPLTFWLAYQDAVIARSYVLFTPLGFAAAALLRNRARRPVLLALILALCINLSLHGLIAACGLALVAIVQARQEQRLRSEAPLWRRPIWALASLILLGGIGLAVYSAYPPRDDSFPAARNLALSMQKMDAQLQGKTLAAKNRLKHPEKAASGELIPIPYPQHHRTPMQALRRKAARALGAITFPLSDVGLYGLVLFGALCWLALTTPAMERLGAPQPGPLGWTGLLPYLLLLLVFSSMYLAPRHCGMIMTGFLIALWLVWPATSRPPSRGHRILVMLLIIMAAEQIGWTAHALWSSMHHPSAPGAATAAFLKQQPAPTIDGFYYHSMNILPYFPRNIYAN